MGYKDDIIIRPFCIILPQMSRCLKYFDNGGKKSMSFMAKYNSILIKFSEIWKKIKKTLNIKIHSTSVYQEEYIKVKVNEFSGVVNTNVWVDKVPAEDVHKTFLACIIINSVIKKKNKNNPQVYLEKGKDRMKKKKIPEFIDVEMESDSS